MGQMCGKKFGRMYELVRVGRIASGVPKTHVCLQVWLFKLVHPQVFASKFTFKTEPEESQKNAFFLLGHGGTRLPAGSGALECKCANSA